MTYSKLRRCHAQFTSWRSLEDISARRSAIVGPRGDSGTIFLREAKKKVRVLPHRSGFGQIQKDDRRERTSRGGTSQRNKTSSPTEDHKRSGRVSQPHSKSQPKCCNAGEWRFGRNKYVVVWHCEAKIYLFSTVPTTFKKCHANTVCGISAVRR